MGSEVGGPISSTSLKNWIAQQRLFGLKVSNWKSKWTCVIMLTLFLKSLIKKCPMLTPLKLTILHTGLWAEQETLAHAVLT